MTQRFTSLELCAGAGGQALGLERAGFDHVGVVEIDPDCCATLRKNRPNWQVFEQDLCEFAKSDLSGFKHIDLLAGGLPCPPFSIAGKQLGERDERNLFPVALDLVEMLEPRAVMIENVRGFLGAVFEDYRKHLVKRFDQLGYHAEWRLLNASDFGVPQLRPRVVIVAMRREMAPLFAWPAVLEHNPVTVGEALRDLMGVNGWRGVKRWCAGADEIAPTLVGGSKKHGGPDLGPTRARQAWASLGVNGKSLAEMAPDRDFVGTPRLTVPMVARIQGFPDDWHFTGRKTAAYRQVGNAFPPPVAAAVATKIHEALEGANQLRTQRRA
jgi:DNA (cytosine-5)-methyltransferase 1